MDNTPYQSTLVYERSLLGGQCDDAADCAIMNGIAPSCDAIESLSILNDLQTVTRAGDSVNHPLQLIESCIMDGYVLNKSAIVVKSPQECLHALPRSREEKFSNSCHLLWISCDPWRLPDKR